MSKKLPTKRDVRFILAEDVMQESMGKASLQGFMPGDEFLVGGNPPPGASPNVAFVVPSLAFLFVVRVGGEGKFDGRFRAIAPDKKTVVFDSPAGQLLEKFAAKAAVFGTIAKPFIGPALGIYTVQLVLGQSQIFFSDDDRQSPLEPGI